MSVASGALIAVVALLVAVFLPRGVPALRGGTVPASPPTMRAASRPLLQRAVVFAVVTSIGAGVLGAAVLGSTDAAARSTAALANGGDVRIVLPSTAGTAGASGLQLPDGTASTRVLRTDLDLDGAATELVAVDSAALPAFLPSGSPIDADRLADDLRPPIPAPEPALDLQPTARQVRLQLTTAPLDAAVDAPAAALRAQVVAWLEREDGTLQRVSAGTLSITPDQTQQHSLSFSLPEDLRPERIAAVDLVLSQAVAGMPSAGFALALASSSSDTGIGTGESRFAASSDLAVVPGLPGVTEAGVQNLLEGAGFSVETLSAQPLTVRLAPRAAADGVAVVAPSSLGAAESQDLILTLGGAGLPAVVVAVLPAVPGEVAGPAVLADLRTVSYALLSTLEGPPGAGELWVSAPDPGSLAASLREATPDGTLMTTAMVDSLGASLVPLVWLTAGACLLGAFYLVLRSPGAQPAGPIGRNGVLLVVAGALLGLVAGALAAATLGPALGLGDGLLLRGPFMFDPGLLLVTLVAALGFVGSSVLRGVTPGKRRTVP
ncbi:hypothetical protein GM708_16665 [Vibrio cholerae]|nr:hypothetical protein [Vibrio cholerae]